MAHLRKIGWMLLLVLLVSHCKHTDQSLLQTELSAQSWSLGAKLSTPASRTYAFSWTNDADYVVDSKKALETKLSDARARNATGRSIDYRSAKAGAGIYGAADPFVSKSFGKYLIVLPFAPSKPLLALAGSYDDPRYREIIQSDALGVVYAWESWMLDAEGKSSGHAVVVRDSSLLDLSQLRVIGPVASDFSCKNLQPAPDVGHLWIEALTQASPDFFGCTLPVIQEYAAYFYSDQGKVEFTKRREHLPLLFAANIRYGSFLAEAAGVKADAVKCGTTPYCSLLFARTITDNIRNSWPQKGESDVRWNEALGLDELVRVSKEYGLLKSDQNPDSVQQLHAALVKTLQVLKPNFALVVDSHIAFYNQIMALLRAESMLLWR